jgi:hypothetical protein
MAAWLHLPHHDVVTVTPQGHVTRITEMYSNTTWVDWDVCVVFQGWGDGEHKGIVYWGSNTHIALVYLHCFYPRKYRTK